MHLIMKTQLATRNIRRHMPYNNYISYDICHSFTKAATNTQH